MVFRNRSRAAGQRLRAFTLIEMLVVISIIMILAGIMLPSLRHAREEARITNCISNLKQLGTAINIYAHHYGEGDVEAFPPWVTLLMQTGGKQHYVSEKRLFHCPDDVTEGRMGGRPDNLKSWYGSTLTVIKQFEMADVDRHPGALNGQGPKNETDGGLNCSYLFEYSGEPCDWIYEGLSAPIASGTTSGVPVAPDVPEWQWGKAPPDWDTFVSMVDRNKDGILSWNEVKMFSRAGRKTYDLPGWGIRVPILRCYWHVEGMKVLKHESLVLNLRGDTSADRGVSAWYKFR